MECWVCDATPKGLCRFCNRAVCKQHAQTRPFLFEVWEDHGDLRGLAVEDALYCGVCKLHAEPIDLEFLRGSAVRL
jgi:hypothetical protein